MLLQNLLAANDFATIAGVLEDFLSSWWTPVLGVMGGLGVVLGVICAVKLWSAHANGDEAKIKEARRLVLGIFIGYGIFFIMVAIVPVLVAAFGDWTGKYM